MLEPRPHAEWIETIMGVLVALWTLMLVLGLIAVIP